MLRKSVKAIAKKTLSVLLTVSLLLCLCACGDGPIMRVVEDETAVVRQEMLPRNGTQRWKQIAVRVAAQDSSELTAQMTLIDEKYAQLEKTADLAYISNSKYYMLLVQQLIKNMDSVTADIETLAAYEKSPPPAQTQATETQTADTDENAEQAAMTKEDYRKALRLTSEKVLELWSALDEITVRFNDYMTIMNALVNHNGLLGLVSNIEQLSWEGTFPADYFFNADIPDQKNLDTLMDGSKYVKSFGVADAELYAMSFGSTDETDTMKLINSMRGRGVLTSLLTNNDDGLQWYGSWIDEGGQACYYFVWFKEGGLGSIVEKFIGQDTERIVVAGSFDFMTCVSATLGT